MPERSVSRIAVNSGEGIRGAPMPLATRRVGMGSRRGVVGSLGLAMAQPAFELFDRGREVVAGGTQEVDVVEVLVAGEAVGQVIARIDVGEHFAAAGAEEAESSVAEFRSR